MTRLIRAAETAAIGIVLGVAIVRWLGWRTVVSCVVPGRGR
jgi:hypothetical protein